MKYTKPEVEIVDLDVADVITLSLGDENKFDEIVINSVQTEEKESVFN